MLWKMGFCANCSLSLKSKININDPMSPPCSTKPCSQPCATHVQAKWNLSRIDAVKRARIAGMSGIFLQGRWCPGGQSQCQKEKLFAPPERTSSSPFFDLPSDWRGKQRTLPTLCDRHKSSLLSCHLLTIAENRYFVYAELKLLRICNPTSLSPPRALDLIYATEAKWDSKLNYHFFDIFSMSSYS